MFASSWGLEVTVSSGRHRKCVKGGLAAAGGLRWPCRRGILHDVGEIMGVLYPDST
jgi:hypothetical protein